MYRSVRQSPIQLHTTWLLAGVLFALITIGAQTSYATDPLGSVAATSVSCSSVGGSGGVPNGTCFKAEISCPGISDIPAGVKVNQPRGNSIGTVLFTIGGGGSDWYDQHFTFGALAIQTVVNAGYTAVQMSFQFHPKGNGNAPFTGWLTGPGGPRTLACRWVTLAHWAHENIRSNNTPFCATGNSAGSAVAGYALAVYGLAAEFNMLEETSGPPFTDIDAGCLCNAPKVELPCVGGRFSECYRSEANVFLDPAYDNKACSQAENTHHSPFERTFIHDSLDSSDAQVNFPNTDLHFVFGGLDASPGAAQGVAWVPLIMGKSKPTVDCVADAPHEIPNVLDGAQKIASDLINFCR